MTTETVADYRAALTLALIDEADIRAIMVTDLVSLVDGIMPAIEEQLEQADGPDAGEWKVTVDLATYARDMWRFRFVQPEMIAAYGELAAAYGDRELTPDGQDAAQSGTLSLTSAQLVALVDAIRREPTETELTTKNEELQDGSTRITVTKKVLEP